MRKQPYPLTDLTGGLDISKDPYLLEDKDSPYILEVRHHMGLLKKEFGVNSFATPVLGIPMLLEAFYLTDGTVYQMCITTKAAYKLDATKIEWVDITQGVGIDDCQSAWTASANVTASNPSSGKVGTKCVKLVIAADFTTGLAGFIAISETDLTGCDHVHLLIKSSVDTSAGDLQLLLDDTNTCVSPIETIDIPALTANTWTRVSLAIATPASCGAILAVGLKVAVDIGALDVYMDEIKGVEELTGTQAYPVFSATFLDTYIVTNGKDAIQKWTGSGTFADLGGSPPTYAKTICTFMSHLVLGGTQESGTAYPFRLRWSSAGTIETWTGGTSGYVDLVDTIDWITHIKLLGNKCFVYKDYSIWELTYTGGTQVFLPELKINGSGTMAPNTIIDRGNTHIFYSDGAIVEFDGTYTVSLSDKINPLLFETGEKILNLSTINYATALYLEEVQTYVLSFPYEEVVFKLNYTDKSWIRFNSKDWCTLGYYSSGTATPLIWSAAVGAWQDSPYGSWKRRSLPTNSPTMLIGDSDGQIWEDDRVTTSTGELVWITKDFLFGHAHRITEVRILYRYGGFTIYYSLDGGLTYTSLGAFAYASDWIEGVKYIDKTTQRIRFKITTSEPQIEIKWLEPWYIPRTRSKTLVDA